MTISELHSIFINSNGISTDTRSISKNDIFFAIKGENFDGNLFAEQAIEKGASYAVVDDKSIAELLGTIYVDNVLKTLQDLAHHHRHQFNIPVIGITGSNGKTTSKELINAVLSEKYNVLVTRGNLNNHLGVPFTLLRMNNEHEIAIVEMGANKPGDIKELADIASPTHGVITNIGKAHIEGFGGLDGVVKTKTELYRNIIQSEGTIFIHTADDLLVDQLKPYSNYIGYGMKSGNIEGGIESADPFISFSWSKQTYRSPIIKTHMVGEYNLTNYLLAICIGDYFQLEPKEINKGISNYRPNNNRSQVLKTNKNTLIVDCYNANPSSMQSAITSFKMVNEPNKLMILGDMLELGTIKEEEHKYIIDLAAKEGIETIFVGKIFCSLNPQSHYYKTVEELIAQHPLEAINKKTILLKGSRGIQLEKLIELL